MLTVLQVTPALEAGGVERTTVDIARAVVAAGGRALVASAGGRLESTLAACGAEFVRMPVDSKNPVTIWRNAARLARLIREEGIDVVHVRSRAPAWSALLAARWASVPLVTTYHGIYNARSALKRLYNGVMARGDVVIANSAFTARHISQTHGIAAERIVVVYPGLELDRFAVEGVTAGRREAVLGAWGLGGDAGPIVLLPGRLTRWKGGLVFVEALGLLSRAGRLGDAKAVLVGDDQGRTGFRAELEGAIARNGLADRILIADHCNDMAAAYAVSTVMVSASVEPEAFGRVAAEAQAMGVPVVVTDHGGAVESVVTAPEDLRTGWRVPPGDAAALAEGIVDALGLTPEQRTAMSQRARAHVAAEFDNATMCERTLDIYRRLTAPT